MHKLIIIAHPNSHGFSHHIAQTFADISMHAGHDVRILDLYATEHMQGYLHLDEHNKPVNDPKLSAMQGFIEQMNGYLHIRSDGTMFQQY